MQPTIILTVFFWENKQIDKQLSKSLGTLIFSKTRKRSVHTLTVFRVPKMQVRENGRQSGVFWKRRFILFVWTEENGGFRIRWCHSSYSACPVWHAFVFPLFQRFRWDGRKWFFENGKKLSVFYNIRIRVNETKHNLRKMLMQGGKEVNKMYYGRYEMNKMTKGPVKRK